MVIFHSYVKIPEGMIYGNQPTSDLMVIFHGIYGGLMESNGIYPLQCEAPQTWCECWWLDSPQ